MLERIKKCSKDEISKSLVTVNNLLKYLKHSIMVPEQWCEYIQLDKIIVIKPAPLNKKYNNSASEQAHSQVMTHYMFCNSSTVGGCIIK